MIPAFGSLAHGNYTVLVVPEGALDRCARGFSELPSATIFISLEWLIQKSRDHFVRTARTTPGMTIALLDEAALMALGAMPSRGIRQFFDLTVPFGTAHPYVDASQAGAPAAVEMFFGREQELRQLVDQQGSCLVYGGRQLGKTALLKQIVARFGTSEFAIVFLEIDEVGSSFPSAEIWDRLSHQLYEAQVLSKSARGEKAVFAGISEWLARHPTRRLLMLLDEADDFLENEMNSGFAIINAMRRLMEETGRRAKFVFAGLHNVQRFVRTPNSPLLHFGQAVQIGPLLGRDRDAARRMVFEPMAAVGLGFERSVDAHHMLSLVGYYPSLLQTFGKTLVARVADEFRREGGIAIPRDLRRKDITDGFQNKEFREHLVEKFRATLRLDQRYELITYVVCFRLDEDRRSSISSAGYTEAEIRARALEYWPQGFAGSSSPDVFEALLDEMVGLGVLNREGDRYTLRSARIAAMLGGSDQILAQLVDFGDRPPEHKSDPIANHRSLSKAGSYSPLSLRREKALLDHLRGEDAAAGVTLLGGVPAVADPDLVLEGLTSLFKAQGWPEPRQLQFRDVASIRKVVSEVRREARTGAPKVILCQGRWPTADETVEMLRSRELRDAGHPVRVIFIGGTADIVASERSGHAEAIRRAGVQMLDVTPWDREAVHHWVARHAKGAGGNAEVVQRVWETSGGYPAILYVADRLMRMKPEDLEPKVAAASSQISTRAMFGIDNPWIGDFVDFLGQFGGRFSDADLRTAADECDGTLPDALVAVATRLGLLRETQRAGKREYELSTPVADVLAALAPAE